MTDIQSNFFEIIQVVGKSSYLKDKKASFMWLELIGLDQDLAKKFEVLAGRPDEKYHKEILESINRLCFLILYHLVGTATVMQLDVEKILFNSYNDRIKNTIYDSASFVLDYEVGRVKGEYISFFEGILSNYFISLTILVSNVGVNFEYLIEKEIKQIRGKIKIKN